MRAPANEVVADRLSVAKMGGHSRRRRRLAYRAHPALNALYPDATMHSSATGPARSLPDVPSSDSVGRGGDAEDHENNDGASFAGLRRLGDALGLTNCSDQDLPQRQPYEPPGRATRRRGSDDSDPIESMERQKLTG